jgi:uncharacterized membrane protein YfcA
MDWPIAVAIILLAFVAACIQALSGFGFSLFIVPFLAILIGPKDTVVLANILSVVANAAQAAHLRHAVERRTATILTVGSFAGMPIGLAVLLLVNTTVLQIAIAVIVILFTVLLMRGLKIHGAGIGGDLATGVVSGILNTSTSMSGPPVVLYFQGRLMPPFEFRATTNVFFLVTALGAVALLALSRAIEPHVLVAAAMSLPSVFLGRLVGNALFARTHPTLFRRLVFGILILSGLSAIVGAIIKAI